MNPAHSREVPSSNVPIAPARAARRGVESERLLVVDPRSHRIAHCKISDLGEFFRPHDVLVVNDAATLPASLRAEPDLELRLIAAEEDGSFRAVSFGAGDHRWATEARGAPRALQVGERLRFSAELCARVVEVDVLEPRLVSLRFDNSGDQFWSALYHAGRPIQYAYLDAPLALWDVQNRYAARPWAFELPSAGHPLTFRVLRALEQRGARLLSVTHAAGLSSTGSATLDARLPLPERYEISARTANAIAQARTQSGRVIACGTSVTRALEGAALSNGQLRTGTGRTDLLLHAGHPLQVVNGLLSGLHEPGTSHFSLLEAFAPRALLTTALEQAARHGYQQHEFGDSCLILADALALG